VYNIYYGKRDILGTARIAALTVDQGSVEQAGDNMNIKYQPKTGNSRWGLRMSRKIVIPICKSDHGIV